MLSSFTHISSPFSPDTPSLIRELLVTSDETVEWGTVSETGTTDSHVFEQSQILYLMLHTISVPIERLLSFVGLNGTNVVRSATKIGAKSALK